MAKKPNKKKSAKKRSAKYEEKLRINGAFIDVINAAVKPVVDAGKEEHLHT